MSEKSRPAFQTKHNAIILCAAKTTPYSRGSELGSEPRPEGAVSAVIYKALFNNAPAGAASAILPLLSTDSCLLSSDS